MPHTGAYGPWFETPRSKITPRLTLDKVVTAIAIGNLQDGRVWMELEDVKSFIGELREEDWPLEVAGIIRRAKSRPSYLEHCFTRLINMPGYFCNDLLAKPDYWQVQPEGIARFRREYQGQMDHVQQTALDKLIHRYGEHLRKIGRVSEQAELGAVRDGKLDPESQTNDLSYAGLTAYHGCENLLECKDEQGETACGGHLNEGHAFPCRICNYQRLLRCMDYKGPLEELLQRKRFGR